MACVIVPAAEAIVTTVIKKIGDKKGSDSIFIQKMDWLNKMLWGGTALLTLEHVWHGEITPWFPFLTAAAEPQSVAEMLREMATNGVAMSIVVTSAWLVMVAVSAAMKKKSLQAEASNPA